MQKLSKYRLEGLLNFGIKKKFLFCVFVFLSFLTLDRNSNPLLCRLVKVGLVPVVQAPEVEAHAHAPLLVLYPEVADTGPVLGRRKPLEDLAALRRMGRGVKVLRHDVGKGGTRATAPLSNRATGRPADLKAPDGCL